MKGIINRKLMTLKVNKNDIYVLVPLIRHYTIRDHEYPIYVHYVHSRPVDEPCDQNETWSSCSSPVSIPSYRKRLHLQHDTFHCTRRPMCTMCRTRVQPAQGCRAQNGSQNSRQPYARVYNITKICSIKTNFQLMLPLVERILNITTLLKISYLVVVCMVRYEPYSEVKKIYHVSGPTLQKWAKKGHIRYKTIQNDVRKTWLYDIDSIGEHMGGKQDEHKHKSSKRVIVYARVSSLHQKEDLERQKTLLRTKYPDATLLSDVGSGLNYTRKNFTKLVRLVCTQQVSTVVVTYRDRITRFGFEMFEEMCSANQVNIVVLGGNDNTEEDELKDDLLSIVNVFVARRNGKRAQRLRKLRKENSQSSDDNKIVSHISPEDPLENSI